MSIGDIINLGTHGTLIIVIFWLLKIISELQLVVRDNTAAITALRVTIEDEISATGGFPSRKN